MEEIALKRPGKQVGTYTYMGCMCTALANAAGTVPATEEIASAKVVTVDNIKDATVREYSPLLFDSDI